MVLCLSHCRANRGGDCRRRCRHRCCCRRRRCRIVVIVVVMWLLGQLRCTLSMWSLCIHRFVCTVHLHLALSRIRRNCGSGTMPSTRTTYAFRFAQIHTSSPYVCATLRLDMRIYPFSQRPSAEVAASFSGGLLCVGLCFRIDVCMCVCVCDEREYRTTSIRERFTRCGSVPFHRHRRPSFGGSIFFCIQTSHFKNVNVVCVRVCVCRKRIENVPLAPFFSFFFFRFRILLLLIWIGKANRIILQTNATTTTEIDNIVGYSYGT